MQNKKAFGVIKVHIQDGNINKINAHITEEIKPEGETSQEIMKKSSLKAAFFML